MLLLIGGFAGALNAVVGGGTYFTYPVLILAGLPPLEANTTNKVAIWFGSLGGVGGYRREIKNNSGPLVWTSAIITGIGSIGGSLLLLVMSTATFNTVLPWLMLLATLLFAFGRHVTKWLEGSLPESGHISSAAHLASYAGLFVIGVYGGFFGAGMSLLVMALYELMSIHNVHQINGLKAVVSLAVNAVSALTFIVIGGIAWFAAIALMIGALAGGYWCAALAKRLPQQWVRCFIILYSAGMTLRFFVI
jgi:uncharacterized membrane protein YfcA